MTQQQLTTYLNRLSLQPNTITLSLEKIKLLRNLLAKHGNDLGLNTNANPTVISSTDSTLELVVKEYNKIQKQFPKVTQGTQPNSIVVDNTQSVIIEPGYYPQRSIITGTTSDADLQQAINSALNGLKQEILRYSATPDQVIKGAKAVVVTEGTDGNLIVRYVDGTVGTASHPLSAGTKSENNTLIIKTKENVELDSNIPYREGGLVEVQVTVLETAGETVQTTKNLPSGYYGNSISIVPVLDIQSPTNKVVNVEADKVVSISLPNNTQIIPTEGFDYIKNAIVKVKEGTAEITTELRGNSVRITPNVTEGWVNNVTVKNAQGSTLEPVDGSILITIPTRTDGTAQISTIDNNGVKEVVITPSEGYYNGSSTIPLKDGTETIKEIKTVSNVLTNEEGVHSIVVPKGYVSSPIVKTIDNSQMSVSTIVVPNQTSFDSISNRHVYITTNEGYTTGEVKHLAVVEASTPELTTKVVDGTQKIVINVDLAGWVDNGDTDVTEAFIPIANAYAEGTLVDRNLEDGQVVFNYQDIANELLGTTIKTPSNGYRYFKSAKVDLSTLIGNINSI